MTEKAYKAFCGDLVKNFDKDWAKVGAKLDFGFKFLSHIPEHAWKGMVQNAVNEWDGWPRNWVKGVKSVYESWKQEAHVIRHTVDCEYCNGNGFFSGTKGVEVKPGVVVNYRHTWRCAACRNWYGALGEKILAAYPLEIKSRGFIIDLFSKPMPADARLYEINQIINMTGQRVNPKTVRPERMPYRETGEEG